MTDGAGEFLAEAGRAGWDCTRLAGDASVRRYARVTAPDGRTAILMQWPEPWDAFLRIGAYLAGVGLCPPAILHTNAKTGLMLIEDLGPQHFAEWLQGHPGDEWALYAAAVDVLVTLHRHVPPAGLTVLTPAVAASMIAPLTAFAPDAPLDPLIEELRRLLDRFAPIADVVALRDYHAENLIWRPERTGTDRVGLLDFQDAVLAPPEYDLASLLRDARRDLPEALVQEMMTRFAEATGRDPAQVRTECAVLAVQRNLRILGVFARLAQAQGKTRYLALLPRVWRHLQRDLSHPAMAHLSALVARHVPAPRPTPA